ncbi:MAG: alpha/beta fold hydrolase [Gemmatimonadetes bacterium]|nr:alpha/beta fold hydrolase [Gemmatimonadota bacterium]
MLRRLWFVVLAAQPVAAQEAMFVLRSGSDTVSLEKFTRSPGKLTSEVLLKGAGARVTFAADISADGTVPQLTTSFWMATDAPGTPARQVARLAFRGDSVIVEIEGGGQTRTERHGTRAGAIPYINPSFALMELVIERSRRLAAAGTEVPMFLVAGGQTLPVTIKPIGADSMSLTMAGGEMRVRVDAAGRIVGGGIPIQNATIERVTNGSAAMTVAKPDYSAPPGAPYTAVDVTVTTPMGHTLAGTLTLPKGAGPGNKVPAVVTITGSGSQDRDEGISLFKGYRPFREIADSLGRRGIAVLRMDDRGFGASGGNAATATSADFAQDIKAGLAYLRTRPEIDAAHLGLVGHSEGGLIAPLVATTEPDLAGIVLLAGTAYTGRQILQFQLSNGIRNDTSHSAAKKDSLLARVPQQIDSMAAGVPWLRFFVDYDPIVTARKVKTPVLILNGATDLQVTPDQVPLLEKAFKQAGNRDVTAKVLKDLNHLFVADPDGYPGRYLELKSFAVDRATIGLVVDWLAKRFLKPAA